MLKKLLLLTMVLGTIGCTNFVARQDESQIVKFQNIKLNKEKNMVNLYKLYYPKSIKQKDIFYEELYTLGSKMIAHNKSINLVIPRELYNDMIKLSKNEVYKNEEIYYKKAYKLDSAERKTIDENIQVSFPEYSGDIQKYLNKQVAYWYNYLGEKNLYIEDMDYTELDKNKLVDRVFKKRQKYIKIVKRILENCVVEENVISEDLEMPVFIKTFSIDDIDFEKIKSKLIIVDGNIKDRVIKDKILLIVGKEVENIRDYKVETILHEVSNPKYLINKLDENGLKIKNFKNFTIKNLMYDSEKKARITHKEEAKKTINFISIESKWGIGSKK